MKRHLSTLLLAIAAITMIACTQGSSEWSHKQRKTMRRALHEYRDMVYIDQLTDAQFLIFADNVTEEIESDYPLYTNIISLPAMSDTIDMYITTTIIEQLDADGSNIRNIYPYRELKKEGIVPSGLDRKQQRAYFKCLARKINNTYSDFEQFFYAVMADTTNKSQIVALQASCAKSLFDYPHSDE